MFCGGAEPERTQQAEQAGIFTISLDFELYWGMRHLSNVANYYPNLVGARSAVPAMLDMFSEYDIHATWATVGFLFADSTEQLTEWAPKRRPDYRDRSHSPYRDLPSVESHETAASIYFAPSLIRLIAATPNQEIATHTYSHYYCLSEGQDLNSFRADLMATRAAAKQLSCNIRTMVFPQNQYRSDYLASCLEQGILAYRGNQPSWMHRPSSRGRFRYLSRFARRMDAYVPLGNCNCTALPLKNTRLPIDIPASRFLLPYSRRLRWLEPLRLRRILSELTCAASHGRLYHLWWHPHNFGVNTELNLAFLRRVLNHYRVLQRHVGMESLNMGELVDRVRN